uniref:Ig-like domain-containing protein n=1 Tax=Astyanax mexicanus TaxID=7994 RepID=A0A8B9RAK9_ASTMX
TDTIFYLNFLFFFYIAKFSLKINPPPVKDLFVFNEAVITCVITGDDKNEVERAKVLWTFGGKTRTKNITDILNNITPPFTKTSNLTLSESEWFSGSEVTCSTERDKTTFSETIQVKKGGERPSVLFYKPENDVKDTENVSLLCEVSSSNLGDVYVMWQKNNDPYMEDKRKVYINNNTVLSYLTVSGRDYNNKNNKFTCAVKDANKENDTAPRINSTSKREIPAPDPGLYINCDKDSSGEDDYNSLWSTASSFIFLFLFTIVYSTVLSLSKMK